MRRSPGWALPAFVAAVAFVPAVALRADPPPGRTAVTGVIAGRVFDPARRPAPGVQVQALAAPGPGTWFDDPMLDEALAPASAADGAVLASTRTGDDGTFRLEGLAPHRPYRVRAVPAAPLVASARVALAEPEPAGSVGLYLARGTPLRLRLVGAGGAGVAGRVSLRHDGAWTLGSGEVLGHEGGSSLLDLATSADGSLEVAAVPSGTLVLTAVAPGHGAMRRRVRTPTEEVLVLPLADAQGGRLEGRVRDEQGRGVAGARVAWSVGAYAERTLRLATTDAGGAFRLDEIPSGRARLDRVLAPGHVLLAAQALRWSDVRVVAGAVATVDVRLAQASTISGTVTDAEGRPVAGAEVTLNFLEREPPRRGRTDAQGRYAFQDLPRGRGEVTVDGLEPLEAPRIPPDHFHPGATALFEIVSPGSALVCDLRVRVGALPPITGVVSDAEGSPVQGAVVTATRQLITNDVKPVGSVLSDAQGRFTIPAPSTWPTWGVQAQKDGRRSREENVRLGQAAFVLTLGQERLVALAGQVVGSDGAPLAGVEVTPCAECSSFGHYSGPQEIGPTVVTDEAGRFRLTDLSPDLITLRLRHRGVWLHRLLHGFAFDKDDGLLWHDLTSGQDLEDVVVHALPTGAIAGTVVNEAGRPLAGVALALALEEAGIGVIRDARATSDAEGRFEAPYLVEGLYAITIDDEGAYEHADEPEDAVKVRTGTRDARVVRRERKPPQANARLTGTLLAADGSPVAVARLDVAGDASLVGAPAQVVDGAFALDLVRGPGEASLTVRDAYDAAGQPLFPGYEQFPLPPASDEPVTLRLPRPPLVAGRVVDPVGAPVAGVVVQLTSEREPDRGLDRMDGPWVLSDAQGAFAFRGYAYPLLRVRPEGDWMEPAPVALADVGAAAAEAIVVTLQRGARITGRATNEDGEPRRAAVTVTWSHPTPGRPPPVETDADGRFLVVVPADARGVTLRAEEGQVLSIPVRIPGRPFAVLRDVEPGRRDLVLRMTAGDVLRGTVVGPEGESVASGWVLLVPAPEEAPAGGSPPPAANPTYGAIRDGEFTLAGVPEGPCRVIAIPEGDEFSPSEVVEASAPGRGVVLRVPRSVEVRFSLEGGAGAAWFVTWAGATASGRALWRSAASDDAGTVRLLLPPTGAGTLYARNPTDDRYALFEGFAAAAPPQAPVPLVEGRSLKGSVEGLAPGEAEGSLVRLRGQGITTSIRLAADATFHARGLPPGRYQAEVEVPAPVSFEMNLGEPLPVVEAGAADVVIRSGIRRVQRR